jgi:hypothetical protein
MAAVLLFLKTYWTHILIAVLVAAGLMYINGLRMTIEQQKTEIVRLEGDVKTLQGINDALGEANVKLANSLRNQTASIKAMVAETDAKVAASAKAVREAKAETQRIQQRYTALLKAPPAVVGDECASTTILLDQYINLRRGELRQ